MSVAVLVLVQSVVNGFERELKTRILGVLPHVSVYAATPLQNTFQFESTTPYKVTHSEFSFAHTNIIGASEFIQGAILLASKSNKSGSLLIGINPENFSQVSELASHVQTGSLAELQSGEFGIVIGVRLADQLQLQMGSYVSVILPDASVTPVGVFPRQKRFKVIAIFNTQSELDSRGVYVHINDASRLFRLGSKVQGVFLKLADIFSAPEVVASILNQTGRGQLRASHWMRSHGNLYHAIKIQKTTMFVLLSFLVTVAAFNLIATLVMVVNERRADVAVFRTLGGSTAMIVLTFFVLGFLIGAFGVILGVLVGVALSILLQEGYQWLDSIFDLNLMSQYFVSYLPVDIRTDDLLIITLLSLLLCMLSTVYPAWRASRLQPGEILSHE